MQEALRRLNEAGPLAAEDPVWQSMISRESKAMTVAQQVLDRERQVVYVQPVAGAPSALPPGHVLVTPITYASPPPSPVIH